MDIHSHAYLRHALPLMNVGRRERILEVGCGTGGAARLLAAEAEEGLVIGLDSSTDRIHEARAKSTAFENILYIWAAAEEIPWQEDFFTLALCVHSIDYFENPEKALRELYRVLIPGGSLWIVNQEFEPDGCSEPVFPDQEPPGRSLRLEDCLQLFTQSGFEIVMQRMIPDYDPPAEAIPHTISRASAGGGRPCGKQVLLLAARKPMRVPEAAAPATDA